MKNSSLDFGGTTIQRKHYVLSCAVKKHSFILLSILMTSPRSQVKNLGVILDSETWVLILASKLKFYQLKNISRARPFLSRANAETLVCTFITCTLAYCNVFLSGLLKKNIVQLQLLQNSAACMLTKTRKSTFYIDFKVSVVATCFLQDWFEDPFISFLKLSVVSDLICLWAACILWTFSSSGGRFLIIPRVGTKTNGEASFYCYSPHLWKDLPDLRAVENLDVFKKATQDPSL